MKAKANLTSVLGAVLLISAAVLSDKAVASQILPAATGDWESTGTWVGGVVPGSGDFVILNNDRTVTVSSGDSAVVGVLQIASSETSPTNTVAGSGTLDITGGSLTITGSSTNSSVGRTGNVSYTSATLNLSGGTLQFVNSANSYALYIGGANTSGSNNASVATFSGGTYAGGLVIGSTNSTLGTGLLTVQGSGTTIGSQFSTQSLTVNAAGTVDFVLSSGGAVSLLNYANNSVTLNSGSVIDVDASAYAGGTETLNLIDFSSLTGTPNVVLIGTNTSSYALSAVSTNGNVVSVTLNAVPEPPVWAMLGVGALALGWAARRRGVRLV